MGSAHAAALEALAERGILDDTECADDRICPHAAIKRWTTAVWLVRALDGQDPPAVDQMFFHDIGTEAWWMPYVERLAALQIAKGCATQPLRFCPDDSLTRTQMASFLIRSFDLDAAEIAMACNADPPLYCPNQPVTRGQMATLLARALGLE